MRRLVKAFGWLRLFLIALTSVMLSVELGDPGHPPIEALCIALYLGGLIEATVSYWRGQVR